MKRARSLFMTTCFLWNPLNFAGYAQNSSSLTKKDNTIPLDADFWSDYPADILADTLVSRMEDTELLAQIFMFGWAGAESSELLNQWVLDSGFLSVKVF